LVEHSCPPPRENTRRRRASVAELAAPGTVAVRALFEPGGEARINDGAAVAAVCSRAPMQAKEDAMAISRRREGDSGSPA
jgi:hypothetical protein